MVPLVAGLAGTAAVRDLDARHYPALTLRISSPQGVQATLLSAIQTHATTKPYQNSAYLARLKAEAAALRVTAARAELAALERRLAAARGGIGGGAGLEAPGSRVLAPPAAAPEGEPATEMDTGL